MAKSEALVLSEPKGEAEGLLEAVSSRKAMKRMGRGRVANGECQMEVMGVNI